MTAEPCFVAGAGIRVPRAQIAAAHFFELSRRGELVLAHNRAESDVVARVLRVRIAPRHAGHALPVHEVSGVRQAGLIARAIEADVEHVKRAFMQEHKGIVDGLRQSNALGSAEAARTSFAVLVRGAKRSDFGGGEAFFQSVRFGEQRETQHGHSQSGRKFATRDLRAHLNRPRFPTARF